MKIAQQLEEVLEKKFKKHFVAELLNISRPTLNSKLKKDNFTDEEIGVLASNGIITIDYSKV